MTVAIDQGSIVALGEGIRVRVAQLVAQIARGFGVFDGRVGLSMQNSHDRTGGHQRPLVFVRLLSQGQNVDLSEVIEGRAP